MRVLKPDGVLIFKWSECDIPADKVWKAIGQKPLFGHHSGYKGVWWDAHRQMWVAYISVHGKRIHLGRYHRLEDAVKARQRGEDEYFLPLIEQKAAEEVTDR